MADNKNDFDEGAEEIETRVADKYNLGAADLEKVTDFNEEKDDNIQAGDVNHLKAAAEKVISLRAEDVKLLADEFELTKATAERFLIRHRGDIKSTLRDLVD